MLTSDQIAIAAAVISGLSLFVSIISLTLGWKIHRESGEAVAVAGFVDLKFLDHDETPGSDLYYPMQANVVLDNHGRTPVTAREVALELFDDARQQVAFLSTSISSTSRPIRIDAYGSETVSMTTGKASPGEKDRTQFVRDEFMHRRSAIVWRHPAILTVTLASGRRWKQAVLVLGGPSIG